MKNVKETRRVDGVRELDEPEHGLWTFHQPLSVLGAEIGTRMTVVRLRSGELLVHSPIRMTTEIAQKLDQLGRVGHVLAPNFEHYLFVRDYKEKYPSAQLYGAPGVDRKLPGVRFDVVLAYPHTIGALDDTLVQLYFRSSNELQELVLFHSDTRTLITADLAFNIQSSDTLVSRVLLRLNDSYETFGPSRVCRSHITERSLARSDVDKILALAPERIVVSHGDLLLAGATEALRRGYAWLR